MKNRTEALATTLESGAEALATLASTMSPADWETRLPRDGRKAGVVVHHVASMYPLEIELARKLAAGGALTDVTWNAVHEMNARHAREHDCVSCEETVALLRQNAAAAAEAIRAMTEEELDRVAANSLYSGAALSCQFMLEDHAVRHAFHHTAAIRAAIRM